MSVDDIGGDDIGGDALDDVFPSSAAAEKKANKFQPKPRIKPKKPAASISNASNEPEVSVAVETKIVATGVVSEEAMDVSLQVVEAQDQVDTDEELTHELACDPDKEEDEGMPLLVGMEPCDDIFAQPSETAGIKKVCKFQPKSCSQPKGKKAKSTSRSLLDAAETATGSIEAQTDTQPSFLQVMNDEENIPHLVSEILDDVDFQLDRKNAGNEELDDLSVMKPFDCTLSESTSTTGKTALKFRPKAVKSSTPGNANGVQDSTSSQWDSLVMDIEPLEDFNHCVGSLTDEQDKSIEMPSVDAGSAGDNEVFETIDLALDSDTYFGGKTKLPAVSEDMGYEGRSQGDDEQTQERLDDQSKSKAFEDLNDNKSSRKSRRTTARKVNIEIGECSDAENANDSRMGEGHSDDDHSGEYMPKQKKRLKRSKRQMADPDKPTKTRRKASKEPDSTKSKPPKKRFPHGTQRKKRQVDKVLLETPEYELDLRQIAIKQLILLGEAREKTQSKEATDLKNSQSNSGSFPGGNYFDPDNPYGDDTDPYGDEEHRNMLRNSQKINYMTHMVKRHRGKWSKAETELFYEAIRQFGTDFGMIVQLFPNRTREQVKSKFKLEDRKHPVEIRDAMSRRSGDHSHYEKVIQMLQAQAEEESRQDDENGDPTTAPSHDDANGNEEQREQPEKEEPEAIDGFDSVLTDPEKLNDDVIDYNEYEGVEWDDNGSFPQSEEKYSDFEEIF